MLQGCAVLLGSALQFMTGSHLLKKRLPRFSHLLFILPELCRPKSPTDSLEILDCLRTAKNLPGLRSEASCKAHQNEEKDFSAFLEL